MQIVIARNGTQHCPLELVPMRMRRGEVCNVTMEPPWGLEPDDALALDVPPETRLTAELHLVSFTSNRCERQ